MQHHKGNSDRQDENGDTIDWLSIYRHGHDGEAENPWGYVFLSFFRDDVGAIKKELRKRDNGDLLLGQYRAGRIRDHTVLRDVRLRLIGVYCDSFISCRFFISDTASVI